MIAVVIAIMIAVVIALNIGIQGSDNNFIILRSTYFY
jgi:hypothetical protein